MCGVLGVVAVEWTDIGLYLLAKKKGLAQF